jgi:hypothetical protein
MMLEIVSSKRLSTDGRGGVGYSLMTEADVLSGVN